MLAAISAWPQFEENSLALGFIPGISNAHTIYSGCLSPLQGSGIEILPWANRDFSLAQLLVGVTAQVP